MSTSPASTSLQKIVLLQRVLRFACKDTLKIVELAHVNRTWHETANDFDTASIIWHQMLGECSRFYVKRESFDAPQVSPQPQSREATEAEMMAQHMRLAAMRAEEAIDRSNVVDVHKQVGGEIVTGVNRNLNLVFHAAVRYEALWVIRKLLKAGIRQAANWNSRNESVRGRIPLHVAAAFGCIASLDVLIEHSTQHDHSKNKSASSYSASSSLSPPGDAALHSVDLHQVAGTYHQGQTVLHVAARADKHAFEMVKLLVEKGNIDVNIRAKQRRATAGSTLLHQVVVDAVTAPASSPFGDTAMKILRYLIKEVPSIAVDAEDLEQGFTSLQLAIRKGAGGPFASSATGVVRVLLEESAPGKKPNVNYQSSSPESRSVRLTCLHLCAQYEKLADLPITKLLLTAGADPDLQEDHGFTPLHLAVMGNSPKFVECLLAAKDKWGGIKNANPLLTDSSGQTPRDFAVARKLDEMVTLLYVNS